LKWSKLFTIGFAIYNKLESEYKWSIFADMLVLFQKIRLFKLVLDGVLIS